MHPIVDVDPKSMLIFTSICKTWSTWQCGCSLNTRRTWGERTRGKLFFWVEKDAFWMKQEEEGKLEIALLVMNEENDACSL